MHFLVKWIKFSVKKKNKTLKKYWKNGQKYWKSQGILSVRKSGNPVKLKITQLTLGGLAQMDRHWDQNTKVLV